MELGEWLRNLGLERYEAPFRDQAIDMDVLADLTEHDLSLLGVALGDRKRLRKAIAGLVSIPTLTAPAPRPARDEAERRMVAVMFCDLVGSTKLATRLDAEDWRDLLGAYVDEAAKAVTEFGGHVLKILGDGVMALFGYPVAQENDAERAVRAGLAIHRALGELSARNEARGLPALVARIGVDLGPVVVDSVGEVYGDPPNVAARVQTAAEPGQLLVTAAVQRQIAGLFVAEDRGAFDLKGVQGQPTLYRILRASGAGRRLGQRRRTPLVNREEERAELLRRWRAALAGEGQFLLFTGEPGIGKSRLIDEFHDWLGDTPHTWVEWRASQILQNTPLHPVGRMGAASLRRRGHRPPKSVWRNSKRRSSASISTRWIMRRCWRRSSTSIPRRRASARSRRRNSAAGRWRRSSPGSSPPRARSRWCWRSRICIGSTRRPSKCWIA